MDYKEMKLGEKQELFSQLYSHLIQYAIKSGYSVRMGDVFRDPRVHGKPGHKKGYSAAYSCHKWKIAGDINLFKDGKYLTGTEDHRPLGEYWESLHPLCRWGGRFKKPDGNHYSLTHQGKA